MYFFKKNNLVIDSSNICVSCDTTCEIGYCDYGNNSTSCKRCNSLYFLQNSPSTSSCVAANLCGGTKVGILSIDNTLGTGNICNLTCPSQKCIYFY